MERRSYLSGQLHVERRLTLNKDNGKYLICEDHSAHIRVPYLHCLLRCAKKNTCHCIAEFLKEASRTDDPGKQGVIDEIEI
jgi:hypothetical protein